MSWNTSVVTNAGVDLLNESLAGHTLTIESAVGGAGTQTEDEIKAATDVAEPKQALKLTGIEDFEDGKRIGIQITNEGISESYILHQIGVKAHLEYEEDLTLLFVLQDERGVEIPTEAENPDFIFEVYAVISISNEANIDVTVNTGVTASVSYVDEKVSSEISEHSEDTNSHQDIRDMATEAYDPESTYDAGAYCIYDGKLYKALDDISTPEAWTESHWEETSVGAELLELEAALSNKADKGPPQVYDLLMADGYSLGVDGAGFGKTQEGVVSVYFSVYGAFTASSSDIGGEAFATLPEGYRPTGKIPVPVVQQDIPGPDWVKVIVHPDGSMRYYGNGSTTAIYGSVSFMAAN